MSTTETKILNSLSMIAYDKNRYKHFIIDNYKGQLVYQFKSSESPKLYNPHNLLFKITHMNSIYKVYIFMKNIFIIKSKSVDKN